MQRTPILKKIAMITMALLMIVGIIFAVSNFISVELEGAAAWKKAHYVTEDFIPCFGDGQDCCIVSPDTR